MESLVVSIAPVADIVKMYRQVKIDEDDAMFQFIFWQDCPKGEISDYKLMIVIGTATALYQAVRTLLQVAYDEGENYPLAKHNVLNCLCMDDLMTTFATAWNQVWKHINR